MPALPRHPARSLLLAAVLAASAPAQVPQQISVQGRLTTAGGAPISDPTTVTFRLYDSVSGGTADFTETEVVVPDAGGAFATILGDGGPLTGTLFETSRWLSFEVGTSGELAPRVLLATSPYAFRAEVALTLDPDTNVSFGGNKLIDLDGPAAANHAATKGYVDGEVGAVDADLAVVEGDVSALQSAVTTLQGDMAVVQGDLALVQGDVSALDSAVTTVEGDLAAHLLDAAVHFTQAAISIPHAQVSDFDAGVTASTHAGRTDNPHAVDKAQVGLGNVPDLKANLTGTSAPTRFDDGLDGYAPGSRWIDEESGTAYVLTDLPGTGAALWRAATPSRFTIPVSPVLVGGVPDPTLSGDALEAALASITDSADDRWYQVVLEPGTYLMNSGHILPGYVRIRGAGMEATTIVATANLQATGRNVLEDLEVDSSSATTIGISVGVGEELRLERVHLFTDRNSTGSYRPLDIQGVAWVRGSRISDQNTGSGSAYCALVSGSDAALHLDASSCSISNGAGSVFGIYVQSGATATLRGGEIELVSQGFSSGIDFPSSGGEVTVEGTRIVVSTPGNGSGIKALGDRCSVRDADVEVTGGNGADGAYLRCNETSLLATSRVSFAGGGGSASYAVWVGDSTGEASSSGNTITVSTTSCTNLYGMYLEGGRAASTGDSIEVTSTTTSGSLYGVRLETDGGSVSGMNLAVSGAGGTTRGFYLNDPTGTTITGLNGSVTGATGVSGIYVGSTTLAANGLNLHASGTSGTVVGIRSYDDLLVGSSRLLVENTGTGDATAFEAGPGSGERVIVIGSRVDVTAASGTASLADAVNSGGNPDLQFLAGHATGDQDGTDVDCTSSVCPGP